MFRLGVEQERKKIGRSERTGRFPHLIEINRGVALSDRINRGRPCSVCFTKPHARPTPALHVL